MAFHCDLSVAALIGIILLIGIVKKNGSVLVDLVLAAKRNQGMTPRRRSPRMCAAPSA